MDSIRKWVSFMSLPISNRVEYSDRSLLWPWERTSLFRLRMSQRSYLKIDSNTSSTLMDFFGLAKSSSTSVSELLRSSCYVFWLVRAEIFRKIVRTCLWLNPRSLRILSLAVREWFMVGMQFSSSVTLLFFSQLMGGGDWKWQVRYAGKDK